MFMNDEGLSRKKDNIYQFNFSSQWSTTKV